MLEFKYIDKFSRCVSKASLIKYNLIFTFLFYTYYLISKLYYSYIKRRNSWVCNI